MTPPPLPCPTPPSYPKMKKISIMLIVGVDQSLFFNGSFGDRACNAASNLGVCDLPTMNWLGDEEAEIQYKI